MVDGEWQPVETDATSLEEASSSDAAPDGDAERHDGPQGGPGPEGSPTTPEPGGSEGLPWAPPPKARLQAVHVLAGLGISIVMAIIGVFLIIGATNLPYQLGGEDYYENSSYDMVVGLAMFAVVAAYVTAHAMLAHAARKRWNMPGLAIGLIVMGSIGFLFLAFCGFLAYAFLGY